MWPDPSKIDTSLDSRAATFENPSGERGAGGVAQDGRKGAPSKRLASGERVVLADIEGSGVLRHIWMTFQPQPPQTMRAMWMEVFYDGADEPSVSVPCLDFFGLPHGRPLPYSSALTAAQEGRGFNAFFPMPFQHAVRVEVTNSALRPMDLYYQIDYTLQVVDEPSYLHVPWRRENPTTLKRDVTIVDGLRGPGRFLGCVVGVRVLDEGLWYGEGEVKVFKDGDTALPTICGTGLEDYVGSAWGLGAHDAPFAGTPLNVAPQGRIEPDFVGFYRWHVPDPVMFERELRVTIQQIGAAFFVDEPSFRAFSETHPPAGRGWDMQPGRGLYATGIHERVDDYCATAFVYCQHVQPVQRLDISDALRGIERLDYERPLPLEGLIS